MDRIEIATVMRDGTTPRTQMMSQKRCITDGPMVHAELMNYLGECMHNFSVENQVSVPRGHFQYPGYATEKAQVFMKFDRVGLMY